MRRLIVAAVALLPCAAFADQKSPATITLPTPVLEHVVSVLRNGASRSEQDFLALQIVEAAQADASKAAAPTEAAPSTH